MKIRHRDTRNYLKLLVAIILGSYAFNNLLGPTTTKKDYVVIIGALFLMFNFLTNKKKEYITINNKMLITGVLFKNKIYLEDVIEIKITKNSLVFKTTHNISKLNISKMYVLDKQELLKNLKDLNIKVVSCYYILKDNA